MTSGLHAALIAVWQSESIPPDLNRELVIPSWKGIWDRQGRNNCHRITLPTEPGKVPAPLLLLGTRGQLLNLEKSEQSRFTSGRQLAVSERFMY